ncbi:SIS domain-containing protein [candidate division KSB1 bacterium]|nr:SIS domain-containing protein [candidate division KSB1 bacterium]
MNNLTPIENQILEEMLQRRPDLQDAVPALLQLHDALVASYDAGGKFLICGNGGSHADAVHIAGELAKSFERLRPVPAEFAEKIRPLPFGEDLAQYLEVGLPAIALGTSGPLKTAIENDSPMRDIAFAQEAYALIKPEDVLMGISTSGNAGNCLMALSVAKASGAKTVSLTGQKGGKMAAFADIALKAPGDSVKVIQEGHLVLYHTMCAMIEAHYFEEKR